MTKKKSGKCSSESTIAALAQADHPRYLGDPTIIDGLLRPLFKAALDDCTAYLDGRLTIDEASASEKALAGTLADVLLGQDERYGVMGHWNGGGALSAFLRRQLDIKTADDHQAVVEALLALFAAPACILAVH